MEINYYYARKIIVHIFHLSVERNLPTGRQVCYTLFLRKQALEGARPAGWRETAAIRHAAHGNPGKLFPRRPKIMELLE